MRSRPMTMAAAALTISMLSGLSLYAQQEVRSSGGDGYSSSSALLADPSAPLPTAAMPATPPDAGSRYRYVPRVEWFLGYSYVRAVPTMAAGNRVVWLNGGSTSVAFNVNRYLGFVGDFGAYTNSKVELQGGSNSTVDVDNPNVGAFSYLVGPRLSFRKSDRVVPFLQVLAGGMHANQVTLAQCSVNCTLLPAQSSFAMTAGSGLDVAIRRHFALRIVQAEYLMTRFASVSTGSSATQNDIRLSSGIVLRFGGSRPQVQAMSHPPTAACSIDKNAVYAGSNEIVGVHARATDPDNRPLTYAWTANGGSVTGTGADAQWNSADAAPGAYTVSVQVADDRGGTANCSADIQVQAPVALSPLTLSCSADKTSVIAGDVVHLTATPGDATHNPLTYSWNATGGQIVGAGAAVELDTTGLATGTYTVAAHATGAESGSAECSVNVDARTLTPLEQKLALHSIYFPTAQPTVEDPSGGLVDSQKVILVSLASDFKAYLASNPDAKLLLEGHADPRASEQYNQALSQRRVDSARQFLIEQGVPAEDLQTKAFGEEQDLTDDQIRAEIARNPELNPDQRQKLLDNLATIILASNRRVDVTLTTTGQRSIRQYPFNAADSLTLLQQDAPR